MKHSDRLEICGDTLRYRVRGSAAWELPISQLRVIGEATNDHGPCLDDYFLCFATDADAWYEASFYAEGRDASLQRLERTLGCELRLRLVGSTDYASNVLWPPQLSGIAMFTFRPVEPTNAIRRLIGLGQNTQVFSYALLQELQSEARRL